MNKKVLMQVGCFLTMFILEMIAAYTDPSSVAFSVLLILAVLMVPVFILVGRMPEASAKPIETETKAERSIAKAA